MPIGIPKPAWLSCVVLVLISSYLGAGKRRSQLKWTVSWTNWQAQLGLKPSTDGLRHHCHELGRRGECQESGSANSKSNHKSEREVHGEVEVHGQPEVCGGRGELIEFSWAKPGAGPASMYINCIDYYRGGSEKNYFASIGVHWQWAANPFLHRFWTVSRRKIRVQDS